MRFVRPRLAFGLLVLLGLSVTHLPVLTRALPLPASNFVICTKADWRNLLLFFLVNYASHAATVVLPPGAKPLTSIPWILIALFFPLSGLGRAAGLLLSDFIFYRRTLQNPDLDEVRLAARRGAFALVGRAEGWMPATTHREEVYLRLMQTPISTTTPEGAIDNNQMPRAQIRLNIHPGAMPMEVNKHTHAFLDPHLPDHYKLYSLYHLELAQLLEIDSDALCDAKTIPLSRSQSWAKMVISVVQIVASSITLYRSRGSQIDQFGYAAFGLTVFPYALMSLVNAICLGILGDYASIYILRTQVFYEAKKRNENCGDPGPIPPIEESAQTPSQLGEFLSGPLGVGLLVSARTLTNEKGDTVLSLEEGDQEERFTLSESSINEDTDSYIFSIYPYVSRIPDRISKPDIDQQDEVARRATKSDKAGGRLSFFIMLALFLGLVLPYLFLLAFTGFHAHSSTVAQRGWTISWLVANQLVCLLVLMVGTAQPNFSFGGAKLSDSLLIDTGMTILNFFVFFTIPLIPTFGASVVVAKMFLEFGECNIV